MDIFFPPGDISSEEIDEDLIRRSMWREYSLAFYLIRQTVNPQLQLGKCIANWKDISKSLAERPRDRKSQADRLFIKAVS